MGLGSRPAAGARDGNAAERAARDRGATSALAESRSEEIRTVNQWAKHINLQSTIDPLHILRIRCKFAC